MRTLKSSSKTTLARELGIARSTLYYKSRKESEDWTLKQRIEEVLREHPSYGSRRIATHLNLNRKKVKRVMNIFGIRPYRRRGRKWRKPRTSVTEYPNLLLTTTPLYPHHIWVSDFTYIPWKGRTLYLCTVMDVFTRKVVGISVMTNHTTQLTLTALLSAIHGSPRPEIFHSDNGKEYDAKDFKNALYSLTIRISRSKKGCPWENGYQESFYSQFKVELGDPNRFTTLGELVFTIYQTIYVYNHTRIHSALKMSPVQFLEGRIIS